MTTVWKYQLAGVGYQAIQMPSGARAIAFREQNGVLALWAVVDSDRPPTTRRFLVTGTGSPIYGAYEHKHIGTVEFGGFVFHLFEELT